MVDEPTLYGREAPPAAHGRGYVDATPAIWPLGIPAETSASAVEDLRRRLAAAGTAAQYGWGHTIDFGPFRMEGLLGTTYLAMVGAVDRLRWWPPELDGLQVADIGAFSGAVSALLASRGAAAVYAIDEIPEHVEQARLVAEAFGLSQIRPIQASLYDMEPHVPGGSLDYVFLGGVLYHLSDMLAGLVVLRNLLKPGGWLILETNAVECWTHSYANFGRFFAGMWWQPSALCVVDLLRFAGYSDAELVFYAPGRALARARRGAASAPPFTRGLTIPFESLRDPVDRPMDAGVMAPAPDTHAQVGMLRRVGLRAVERTLGLAWRAMRRIRGR